MAAVVAPAHDTRGRTAANDRRRLALGPARRLVVGPTIDSRHRKRGDSSRRATHEKTTTKEEGAASPHRPDKTATRRARDSRRRRLVVVAVVVVIGKYSKSKEELWDETSWGSLLVRLLLLRHPHRHHLHEDARDAPWCDTVLVVVVVRCDCFNGNESECNCSKQGLFLSQKPETLLSIRRCRDPPTKPNTSNQGPPVVSGNALLEWEFELFGKL